MPKKDKRSFPEAFPEQELDQQGSGEVTKDDVRDIQSNADYPTIVLLPGSSTLQLGLSTDPTPHSLPHVIAYRTTTSKSDSERSGGESGDGGRSGGVSSDGGYGNPGMETEESSCLDESLVLKYNTTITPELESVREEKLVAIHDYLSVNRNSLGMGECAVDKDSYVSFNGRVHPIARESDELELTDVSRKPKYVIGNEALYLPPNSGYTLLKPLKYGRLNSSVFLREGAHSLSLVLNMLEDLWVKAIEDYLEISRSDFKYHRVVLLVSDVIDRTVLKELMNVLLIRMEFAAAFLHQESVCGTYCAGLSSACVVNMGDDVTHICCVEDGMSNPNTRVTLKYGGSDITRLFYWLLDQTNFPYKKCQDTSRLDGVLIQQLKESVCHADPTIWGARDCQFSVMSPSPGILLDYEIKLADETIYPPMGVFFPSVFCLPENGVLMSGQSALVSDPADLFDEGHWVTDGGAGQQVKGAGGGLKGVLSEGSGSLESDTLPEVTKRLQRVEPGKILGLDQAVHFSIDCASSLEMKQKLYGSVLIIGGGFAFPGAANMLQARLELKPLPIFSRGTNNIEVFSNPRDLEPSSVAWKGGAVLSCLDTCHELWIEKAEWEFSGVRLLRERAPFMW